MTSLGRAKGLGGFLMVGYHKLLAPNPFARQPLIAELDGQALFPKRLAQTSWHHEPITTLKPLQEIL